MRTIPRSSDLGHGLDSLILIGGEWGWGAKSAPRQKSPRGSPSSPFAGTGMGRDSPAPRGPVDIPRKSPIYEVEKQKKSILLSIELKDLSYDFSNTFSFLGSDIAQTTVNQKTSHHLIKKPPSNSGHCIDQIPPSKALAP
ncbi:hypothetical protein SLA2020_373540 [Shorea laevis]